MILHNVLAFLVCVWSIGMGLKYKRRDWAVLSLLGLLALANLFYVVIEIIFYFKGV